MIMDMPKIGWVERLLTDVEAMTMDEVLATSVIADELNHGVLFVGGDMRGFVLQSHHRRGNTDINSPQAYT